jgi:hypothetical protein
MTPLASLDAGYAALRRADWEAHDGTAADLAQEEFPRE